MQRAKLIALPYTELPPPRDLAPYLDRVWMWTPGCGAADCSNSAGVSIDAGTRVLPDGCVDVIVDALRGTGELVGAMTRALEISNHSADLIAIRFRPGTAAALTGFALCDLTDQSIALADLGIAGALVEQIADATTVDQRIAALVTWLRGCLTGAQAPDPLVSHAVAQLSRGGARIDATANQLGLSRQHLARRFRREVGITPKQFARIARMQRTTAALSRATRPAPAARQLSRLAAEHGYFDQAHLASELRALTGATATTLAAERPMTLAHLYARH